MSWNERELTEEETKILDRYRNTSPDMSPAQTTDFNPADFATKEEREETADYQDESNVKTISRSGWMQVFDQEARGHIGVTENGLYAHALEVSPRDEENDLGWVEGHATRQEAQAALDAAFHEWQGPLVHSEIQYEDQQIAEYEKQNPELAPSLLTQTEPDEEVER